MQALTSSVLAGSAVQGARVQRRKGLAGRQLRAAVSNGARCRAFFKFGGKKSGYDKSSESGVSADSGARAWELQHARPAATCAAAAAAVPPGATLLRPPLLAALRRLCSCAAAAARRCHRRVLPACRPRLPMPSETARPGCAEYFKGESRDDYQGSDVQDYFMYMGMLASEGTYDRCEAMLASERAEGGCTVGLAAAVV